MKKWMNCDAKRQFPSYMSVAMHGTKDANFIEKYFGKHPIRLDAAHKHSVCL